MRQQILNFNRDQYMYESFRAVRSLLEIGEFRLIKLTKLSEQFFYVRQLRLYKSTIAGMNNYRLIAVVSRKGDKETASVEALIELTPILHRFDNERVETAIGRLVGMNGFTYSDIEYATLCRVFDRDGRDNEWLFKLIYADTPVFCDILVAPYIPQTVSEH